jgi:hypothetical protein
MKNTYNKEEKKELNRKYYLANKEKLLVKFAEERKNNYHKVKEINERSRLKNLLKNKEKVKRQSKQHYEKNKDKLLKKARVKNLEYYHNNKNECRERQNKYLKQYQALPGVKEKAKQRRKQYWEKNKSILKTYNKVYYQQNKRKVNEHDRKYKLNKRHTDPIYKLSCKIRGLINISLKKKFTKKSKRTIEILGCSFEEFKSHLEKQFDKNMNWENQGSYWHLDHIKPMALATTEKEIYELNHYTNFQPLEKSENREKSDTYPWIKE